MMLHHSVRAALLGASILVAHVLASCSSDDQTIDPGTGSPTQDSGGATIQVTFEDQSADVGLDSLTITPYKGTDLVKLSDVWASAQISADANTLVFEFVSSDGFTPSSKDCDPLPGDLLDRGYIHPTSRTLTWDESLGLRGCYSVTDTQQMRAQSPTEAPAE